MRYLKGTLNYGLRYVIDHEFRLYRYSDSYWVDNIPDRKSTLTYFFSLGSSVVSWSRRKQLCVEISMDEAEYVAACAPSREEVWLRKFLTRLFDIAMEVTCILCDNQICINLSRTAWCFMIIQNISKSGITIWCRRD